VSFVVLKKTSFLKIIIYVFLWSLLIFIGVVNTGSFVLAQTTQEKSQGLTDEIAKYEAEISRLQSQATTLNNQIAQYDAQIRLAGLKIEQTQEKISQLGGRIDQLEGSLTSLSRAFASRVVESYKMTRLHEPVLMVVTSPDLETAFSNYHYMQKIQEADRDLLVRLEKAQIDYKDQKESEEELEAQLTQQKKLLDVQKVAKAQLLTQTKSDEKRYQELLSQARTQLSALSRFVIGQGGASILSDQTKCDSWGCYYNQRDSLWGNIGLGGSSYSAAEYGCLVSSVSMIASHYGKNIKPSDIALNPSAFVPGTGYLYHSFSVNGISVSLSSVSKDRLDSELAAGRPVIAGLYSGPDHFIVILRKEGSGYIMHDPFLENGSTRLLNDKYTVASISNLRLVSFN